jgi:hypothetical protein
MNHHLAGEGPQEFDMGRLLALAALFGPALQHIQSRRPVDVTPAAKDGSGVNQIALRRKHFSAQNHFRAESDPKKAKMNKG